MSKHRNTGPLRLSAGLGALLLLGAACGGSTTTTTEPTVTTVAPGGQSTTTTDGPTTTADPGPSSTDLPGDPLDFGPRAGDRLAVVGVAHDDTLNVRSAPGTDQGIVVELPPLAEELLALGNTRALSRSIWVEIETPGGRGWASLAYLAYLGIVTDETATVVAGLEGIPTAPDMESLGRLIAETYASDEPASRVQMVTAPVLGDLGEVTFDVLDIGDDALVGYRLHVFGATEDGGASYGLKSLEVTALCGRGVTDDGLCV